MYFPSPPLEEGQSYLKVTGIWCFFGTRCLWCVDLLEKLRSNILVIIILSVYWDTVISIKYNYFILYTCWLFVRVVLVKYTKTCAYTVTLERVRATILAVEKQVLHIVRQRKCVCVCVCVVCVVCVCVCVCGVCVCSVCVCVVCVCGVCVWPLSPSMQRTCAMSCCYLCPVQLFQIFPHCAINITIFGDGGELLYIERVFDFLYALYVKRFSF